MENRVLRLAGLFIVISALAGCAGTPTGSSSASGNSATTPVSPLDAARAEVAQAKAAGYNVDDALIFLRRAEQLAAAEDEKGAAAAAEQARRAVQARKAIDAARPEVEKAIGVAGPLASDAGKLLESAEAALKAGDPVRASELAAQARRQAAEAMEQHHVRAAQAAAEKTNRYKVARGDTLWSISGKPQIYGEPLLWPLLFKSNEERVHNPDRIFPGQSLSINRNPSAAEKKAATRHARHRGPWKGGAAASSDKAYLGR